MSGWRERSAPIIARTIAEVGRSDMPALRKALREAYPFGERRYFPYKVWCSEVRNQLFGKKAPRRPMAATDSNTLDMFKEVST